MRASEDDLKVIQGHLVLLQQCMGPLVEEKVTRVVTGSLRYLFCSQLEQLHRVWNTFFSGRGKITVTGWSINSSNDPSIVAFSGGADIVSGAPLSWGWAGEGVEPAKLFKAALSLDKYLNGACIVFGGERISRREFIDFMANKRGGNHFDTKPVAKKFQRLRQIETEGINGLKIHTNGRDIVHHEIESIMQSVMESTQVRMIRDLQIRMICDLQISAE